MSRTIKLGQAQIALARPLAKLLGAALIVLPGGHFTPVDCPREVAEALCSFLRGLEPDR
jgi:pimeloyl-ACP methyl ester carboxylesterase